MSKQLMYRGEALDGKRVIIGWYRERHWVAGGKEYCSYTIYDGERRQEVEVHPDSVAQSSGQPDNNKVEIFVGQWVRAWIYGDETPQELQVCQRGSAIVIDYEDSDSDVVILSEFVGNLEVIPEGSEDK